MPAIVQLLRIGSGTSELPEWQFTVRGHGPLQQFFYHYRGCQRMKEVSGTCVQDNHAVGNR